MKTTLKYLQSGGGYMGLDDGGVGVEWWCKLCIIIYIGTPSGWLHNTGVYFTDLHKSVPDDHPLHFRTYGTVEFHAFHSSGWMFLDSGRQHGAGVIE